VPDSGERSRRSGKRAQRTVLFHVKKYVHWHSGRWSFHIVPGNAHVLQRSWSCGDCAGTSNGSFGSGRKMQTLMNGMPCGRVSAGASSCGSARPHYPRLAAGASNALRCLRAASERAAFPAVFSAYAMRPGERRRFVLRERQVATLPSGRRCQQRASLPARGQRARGVPGCLFRACHAAG
jgi:hypothetical protein